ncbi:hypothetical protein WMF18_01590 [Sorangium sp. So ce315]|uniref:hypothetical protein n=1 Tax=Sorangium sp. So ce315 TaxID=3133299 RepID=UPI003F5EAD83
MYRRRRSQRRAKLLPEIFEVVIDRVDPVRRRLLEERVESNPDDLRGARVMRP